MGPNAVLEELSDYLAGKWQKDAKPMLVKDWSENLDGGFELISLTIPAIDLKKARKLAEEVGFTTKPVLDSVLLFHRSLKGSYSSNAVGIITESSIEVELIIPGRVRKYLFKKIPEIIDKKLLENSGKRQAKGKKLSKRQEEFGID